MIWAGLFVISSASQSWPLKYVPVCSTYYRRDLKKAWMQLSLLCLLKLVRLSSLRTQLQALVPVCSSYRSLPALLRAHIAPLWLPLQHLHYGMPHLWQMERRSGCRCGPQQAWRYGSSLLAQLCRPAESLTYELTILQKTYSDVLFYEWRFQQ